jgi:very-short-patch-repair endonuclease
MTRIFNRAQQPTTRRALRKSLAPAEALLWTHLRDRQMLGYKFRRQYGVGAFVVDFYCPALKLALEVDGRSHIGEAAGERDAARQAWIEMFDIRFLRFTDQDVLRSTEAVLKHIASVIQQITGVQADSEEP